MSKSFVSCTSPAESHNSMSDDFTHCNCFPVTPPRSSALL